MEISIAEPEEADALADLVNASYEVERFFVAGNRTSAEDVRASMAQGTFLVTRDPAGRIIGTVLFAIDGSTASFGMLAVDPRFQRLGLGHALIEAAEARAREGGAVTMSILVVNVREDLLPRYRRLGYVPVGVAPYVHRPTLRDCHFIRMEKTL
jgi:GNAT superfamily N-acetyltransferase